MSDDARREFVDANILIYAFDKSAGIKRQAAERLISRLWEEGNGCISTQVLQEFFVTVTRKIPRPLSIDVALERVREFSAWRVFTPVAADVVSAIALHRQSSLSFWDAMVVQAAAESGCDVLWTEDLNTGQRIRGVQMLNPFSGG